jgi:hypothetical protein
MEPCERNGALVDNCHLSCSNKPNCGCVQGPDAFARGPRPSHRDRTLPQNGPLVGNPCTGCQLRTQAGRKTCNNDIGSWLIIF